MVFMLVALIGLLAAIGIAVWFAADARRRRAPAPRAGAIDLCCGLLTVGFMALHLAAVVGHIYSGKGFGGEARFAYDFRFFWLILLGGVISIPGLVFLMQARRLTDGDVMPWKRVLWASGALLILSVALVHRDAIALNTALLATINLVSLWAGRKQFGTAAT
jgi:hypothetical protein